MKLRVFSILILCFASVSLHAQFRITGQVTDEAGTGIDGAQVYIKTLDKIVPAGPDGSFVLNVPTKGQYQLILFNFEYQVLEQTVDVQGDVSMSFPLKPLSTDLAEVIISEEREKVFQLTRLNPVEGTAIYAGKKSEVVLLDNVIANKSSNNSRQIYAQVVGLNIYESGDGGLQLSVGGRGLDPNRTSNFNTRQNGYDISADVLGYPESYYTPPAEALQEIQVVRGAASLQYGTQFGGLINFKMHRPSSHKIAVVSRQSVGSFNFFSSFNSFSGTNGKFSHYTYFQYKRGDGYRPNSGFESNNAFTNLNYVFSDKTTLSVDLTYLNYLAQQPGGLTDSQFAQNPNFSNRERNWFEVNWKLASAKLEHEFTNRTKASLMLFGLDAGRNALGYRGDPIDPNTNPVSAEDPTDEFGNYIYPRDLIKGHFQNWGMEGRFLTRYGLGSRDHVLLLGSKLYVANNASIQGPGNSNKGPNFQFSRAAHPDYPAQSSFLFPNKNLAIFGENIFMINDRLSITPGFRFENIRTESAGSYSLVTYDLANNPIGIREETDNRTLSRSFVLFGIGASYQGTGDQEWYLNLSQNYRSVTFSDIRVVNPTFTVDPNISDERGFTSDIGVRGRWKQVLSYDASVFTMVYDDRIGTVFDNRANRVRGNIGNALIYGVELFGDMNLLSFMAVDPARRKLNWFVNAALTDSYYTQSQLQNVEGKKVEFIPFINWKSGLNFGAGNFQGSLQWTYLSAQFTDAENSAIPESSDNRNGVIGEIPSYQIWDLSMAYSYKHVRLESGINNLFNTSYYTRRATGYPGPGIIPSDPRTVYFTLQLSY
jgi:Fe(3+) dicitrate transport protein